MVTDHSDAHVSIPISERKVNGQIFVQLSREDIAAIYPQPEKFILGMNMYRLVQDCRVEPHNTQELLNDLEDDIKSLGSSKSTTSTHKRSLPSSSSSSAACKKRAKLSFKLPMFSKDINKCIKNDSFYTAAQRNKVIRESCTALAGFCREQDRPVTNDEKRDLALNLETSLPLKQKW